MKFNNLNGPTLTPLMEPPKQMQLVHVYKCNGFTLTAVMVPFTSRITTCVSMMSFFWSSTGRSSSTLSLAISSKSFRYIYFPLVLQSQGCSLLKLMASERTEDTKEGESGFLDACGEPEPMKVSPNKNFAPFGKIWDDFFSERDNGFARLSRDGVPRIWKSKQLILTTYFSVVRLIDTGHRCHKLYNSK